MKIKPYIKARIEEHKIELSETVGTLQDLQESFQRGDDVRNAIDRIDNLTKKVLVKRSVIAELKHLLEVK